LIPILLQKVLVWFQNNHQKAKLSTSSTKARHDGRAAITWTARRVAKEALSAELDARILTKDSSATRGTGSYLTHHNHCLTELMNGLSEQQVERFEGVAHLRNTVGVDPILKAKYVQLFTLSCQFSFSVSRQADKHFVKVAKKFTEDVYKQMGVKVFMLVGYQNTEGDLVRAKCVSHSSVCFMLLIDFQGGNRYVHTKSQAILANLQKSW
jgi:hypothetical protein